MTEQPVADRRRAPRKTERIPALVGPKDAPRERCENALIEDLAEKGFRVRSGAPLREFDSFFIYVGEKPHPLHARAMWVRKDGFIEKRATGKAGQAYVAGCRILEKAEAAPTGKPRGAAGRRAQAKRDAAVSAWVLRGLFIAGGLGLLGALVYGAVSLFHLMQ